jgi:hypothetical protein
MIRACDCEAEGRCHEWLDPKTEKGEYSGWGKGTMKSVQCGSCGLVRYLLFTDLKTKETTDILKLFGLPQDRPRSA